MSDFEISERKLRASPEFFIFFYNIFFSVASIIKKNKKKWLRARTGKKVPYSQPLIREDFSNFDPFLTFFFTANALWTQSWN